jgi:hypothetical protein
MLRWLNKILIILLCVLFLISCGFIDLRKIIFSIEPNEPDSILSDSSSPVILKFNTEMNKKNTEKILQVSSDNGVMKGDYFWERNILYFIPVPGWTVGIRYTLSFIGTIESVDGRDLRVEHFVSFYAVNKNSPPLLEWHYPANGAAVGTSDIVLEFIFSRSMDRLSVESALTIEGTGDKTFEWKNENKELKVTVDKALSPWTSYRWNLRDSAKSIDGVPLPKIYSGYFTTNLDKVFPCVVRVFPVLFSGGSWFPTGANIETGLASKQGIAIEFNKPMGENVLRSIRFDPSLSGRTEYLSEKSIVYILTKDPEPETMYTLIVSADTKDSEGLKIGNNYRINFIPDIPFLNILSFSKDSDLVVENITQNARFPVSITPVTGELFFIIRFSFPFSIEEKQNTAQKIILSPFFPRTLLPIALQYVSWIGDDRLAMRWEGLKPGDTETPHYYKLTIPGGKSGISNGMGMYMKEDMIIYLEVVNEK